MPLNITFSTGQKSSITLKDIRELHSATRDWHENTRVDLNVDRGYNQLDPGGTTITCSQDQRLEQGSVRRMDARGPNA